jgi:GTP pyrophosphokinase
VPPELDPILRTLRQFHPKSDTRVVIQAYVTAEELHREQKRRSGEPYITHPLAVAQILADLGMTGPTLAAALLHDTVEDTGYPLADLRAEFGEEIASLVDGVTKLDKVTYGASSAAETVRKMVVAMARDIRVLVIKLADRLHNMRTLQWLPPEKQAIKARETLEIYAPLAHRLGMNTVKWELEDLSFATLHPKMYEEIVRLVGQRAPAREQYLEQVIGDIDERLRAARIRATVTGRPKHYYSVYQKMIVRGHDFSDIYDLVGVRILVDSVRDCYAVLGTLHAAWNPLPGRFKDYIAMPKFNMYQSLHTTVIGPDGKPVEVQIRTHEMHRSAEYGIAAHWRYKQTEVGGKLGPDDLGWLRQLVEWQRETEDPGEFLESLRYDLGSTEVFVFTPRGDVIALPSGSTPVDFAYAVHTELGHRCVGARVNGRLVPLDSPLSNGDAVEVFTSKAEGAGPSLDWLTFVRSPRARSKIKAWFSRERREEAIDKGKDQLLKAMRKEGVSVHRLLSTSALATVAVDLRQHDVSALYASIGEGRISPQTVIHRLVATAGGESAAADDAAEGVTPQGITKMRQRSDSDPGVTVIGSQLGDVWVKLARCCTPVPGDEITGFVTRGNGVSVHRQDCTNVSAMAGQAERFVPVAWSPGASSVFLVNIQVEALDRSRLLADVTRALSDQHVNILAASVSTTKERIAVSRFTFEMGDPKHLGAVLRAVRGVEGVFDAYRV